MPLRKPDWHGSIEDLPPDLRATFFDKVGSAWAGLGAELDRWLKGDPLPALERIWWLTRFYPTESSPKAYPKGWELIASTLAVYATREEWQAGIKVLMDFASVDAGGDSLTGDSVALISWSESAEKALTPWWDLGMANVKAVNAVFERLAEMQDFILAKTERRKAEEEDHENKHPWRGRGESFIVAWLMGHGYTYDDVLTMPFNIWLLFTWHLEGVTG